MNNPFSRKPSRQNQLNKKTANKDPLSVEELLVDGTKRATITTDGRLVSKSDSLKNREEHIDLLKQREWGTT